MSVQRVTGKSLHPIYQLISLNNHGSCMQLCLKGLLLSKTSHAVNTEEGGQEGNRCPREEIQRDKCMPLPLIELLPKAAPKIIQHPIKVLQGTDHS